MDIEIIIKSKYKEKAGFEQQEYTYRHINHISLGRRTFRIRDINNKNISFPYRFWEIITINVDNHHKQTEQEQQEIIDYYEHGQHLS